MGRKRKFGAFTLIELLVVIGVIAILAGIIVGVLPAVQNKGARGRVKTELKALETAIESYKAKHNFYPPSAFREGFPNALFYELTGTTNGPNGFNSIFSRADPPLTAAELKTVFGIDGFLNTATASEESDIPNFYRNLMPRQLRTIQTNGVTFTALACGRKGMDGQMAVWQYTTTPTNNVGSFDLWAEVDIGGKRVIIGNWEK